MKISKFVSVEMPIDAAELATLFWQMDESEQAVFFNVLGRQERLSSQLQMVAECPDLDYEGQEAMLIIGEFWDV